MLTEAEYKALKAKPADQLTEEEKASVAAYENANPPAGSSAGSQNAENQQGNEDDAAAGNQQQPGPVPYDRFKTVNESLKQTQAELKKMQDAEAERQAAAKEAEEKGMLDQQEFEKLATKRKGELQAVTERVATLEAENKKNEEALTKYLEAARKDLPEHILALLDKLDTVDQLEYIAANRETLGAKLPDGPGKLPKSKGNNGSLSEDEKRKRAAQTTL